MTNPTPPEVREIVAGQDALRAAAQFMQAVNDGVAWMLMTGSRLPSVEHSLEVARRNRQLKAAVRSALLQESKS